MIIGLQSGLEKTRVFYKKPNPVGFLNKTRVLLGFLGYMGFMGFSKRKEKLKRFIWRFKDNVHVIMCTYDNNISHFVIQNLFSKFRHDPEIQN